jgi:hypothetical protein
VPYFRISHSTRIPASDPPFDRAILISQVSAIYRYFIVLGIALSLVSCGSGNNQAENSDAIEEGAEELGLKFHHLIASNSPP